MPLDLLLSSVLSLLAAATVVAAATHLASAMTRMRARFLCRALEELLSQLDPRHLSPRDARQLALFLIRHPWLCGRAQAPAAFLRREHFVRLLLNAAAESSPLAIHLRAAFQLESAADARGLTQAIGAHALRFERECPSEPRQHRDTRAIIEAMGPHPLLAHIAVWYPQAMDRATRRYMRSTRVIASLFALSLVLAARLDLMAFFRLHPASPWPGLALSWMLVSLGAPFWYDRLKDLLRLRPVA